MPILGIDNRTENWKTARHLAPLFGANSVRLARRLLLEEEGREDLQQGEVTLELFWKGLRDYEDARRKVSDESVKDTYSRLFPDLREKISAFAPAFRTLQKGNYDASTPEQAKRLTNNIRNTEIDIVLQSPGRLFIGEAKSESAFGGKGSLVLVHQLIRQYVTARILVDFVEPTVKVIPFVVGESRTELLKHSQVEFMLQQGWMRKGHVLAWADIEALR